LLLAATVSAAAVAPALAVEGFVVDADGKPIEDARVCYVVGNAELFCSETNDKGRFELPGSLQDGIRVVADDYLPRTILVAEATTPVVLERSPTLLVKLVDASNGKPISEGQVSVVYSSGQFHGPFPVNASGVRIRRVLRPGEARMLVVAAGYRQPQPQPIDLVPGKETEVSIELQPE
jgi:hypothetical protein